MSTTGPAVHSATMSSPSEKSAENVKDGAEAVVQTLDSDGVRGTAVSSILLSTDAGAIVEQNNLNESIA